MTANLQFEIDKRTDAVLIPNAALRYRPAANLVKAGADAKPEPTSEAKSEGAKQKGPPKEKDSHRGTVYVEEAGGLRAIPVTLGLTDGNMTELVAGDVQPGMALVVGEVRAGPTSEAGNPFTPPRPGTGKKQQ
jgi:HlyD family secretion protein